MTTSVTIRKALDAEKPFIARFLPGYLKELRELDEHQTADPADLEYPYLDLYWSEPERHPFLVLVGSAVAGFALIREIDSASYELAEFYVQPEHRGRDVGATAAVQLFQKFLGTWRVAQEESNAPAQAFWRKVIGRYTQGEYTEERSQHPVGPRQVFISVPLACPD